MKTLRSLCLAACAFILGPVALSLPIFAAETPRPLVVLLTTDPIATESGSENGRFLVVRTGPTQYPSTVFYTLSGTAQNGVDYEQLAGEITIPAGASFAPVPVEAINDVFAEGNERVVATLNDGPFRSPIPPYVICWPHRGVVTIIDNDKPTNEPPHVALTNPPDGAVIPGPADILLTARHLRSA